MATKSKKSTKSARKTVRKAKKAATSRKSYKFNDNARIAVVGEHNRREGSPLYNAFEALKRITTVSGFRKKFTGHFGQYALRTAVKDNYIAVK